MEDRKYETIKLIIYVAIAAVVLGAGIWVSTSRKEKNASVLGDSSDIGSEMSSDAASTIPVTDDAGNPVTSETTYTEPKYLDLFDSIHLDIEGIYPDISSLYVTTAEDDVLPNYVKYDVTSTSDFTPSGAEIVVEVDTSTIEEYLTARNYVPYSTKTIYTINPKKMSSYLVQKDQWTDTVKNDAVTRAAQALVGDPNAQPSEIYVMLPTQSAIFTAENTYAGLYGAYIFFSDGNAVKGAFVSPTLTADGTVEDAALTLCPTFASAAEAYAGTVNERMRVDSALVYFMG